MTDGSPNSAVRANSDQWSAASKRSVSFDYAPEFYEDIAYSCSQCKTPAVYTGAAQKHAYEVRKAHVWQNRSLCGPCHEAEMRGRRLRRELGRCRVLYAADRKRLRRDAEFLRRWLAVAEMLAESGRAAVDAAMLRRRLASKPGGERELEARH